jgi:hypothetical protein
MKNLAIALILVLLSTASFAGSGKKPCKKKTESNPEVIETNINGKGYTFEIDFTAGKGHNAPSFAIWIEDMNENFIQELFVTKAVATGIYKFGDNTSGKWAAGERLYAATLPYFIHKKSKDAAIPNSDKPIVDAYTGATPKQDFLLKTKSDNKIDGKFRILLEINQTWDYNNYWHNAKYPDDKDYKTSCQPSIIYAVTIDPKNLMNEYILNPIGHGHYSGKDGKLYTDLSTFTSALNIIKEVKVVVK